MEIIQGVQIILALKENNQWLQISLEFNEIIFPNNFCILRNYSIQLYACMKISKESK